MKAVGTQIGQNSLCAVSQENYQRPSDGFPPLWKEWRKHYLERLSAPLDGSSQSESDQGEAL